MEILYTLPFRGHKVRSRDPTTLPPQRPSTTDDLPDLKDKDVQAAASKIQAAFKGHKVRKARKLHKGDEDDLPDLTDKGVQDAATKIQAAFKGHKTRQQIKVQKVEEDLPDLADKDVQDATIKIQAAFKGFQVRKAKKVEAPKVPQRPAKPMHSAFH